MSDLLTKMFVPFAVKALNEDEETGVRSFTGLAATWDLDLGGDVIHPGAFKRTLDNWKQAKKNLPLIDSHNYGSVRSIVGKMLEAKETDDGLEAEFEVIDGPDGDEVWRRIKGGFVDGLSIGYRAIKSEEPTEDEQLEGVWRHLKEVALEEVSVVLFPMNPSATIDTASVKALIHAARTRQRPLTDDERAQLKQLDTDIRALLDGAGPTPPGGDPEPQPEGLAPDDPKRRALDARLRDVRIRRLATRARA